MSRTRNNIASIVFVAVLALFLAQPILNASRSAPPGGGKQGAGRTTTTSRAAVSTTTSVTTTTAVTTTTTPAAEPSPSGSPAPPDRLLTSLPKRCFRHASQPSPGLLAAVGDNGVTIAAPGASPVAQLNARGPVGWSASGKFLATGGGKVFDSSGAAKGALFSGAASQWAWSPAGDCALGIVAGKLELGVPGRRGGTLLSATVTGFSISPNGRKVGIAAQDDVSNTFWIADLAGGGLTKVHEVGATVAGTVFGWAPDSKTLYIGSSGTSAGADGYRITSVKVVGGGVLRHRLGLSALAGPDTFSACRSRLLVVAGGTRDTTTNKRLAYLTARKAHYITPQGTTYPSAACSPKLDFIAAVGAPDGSDVSARRLELLRGDGSVAQALTAGSYWDDDPMWGPAGTGIVLVRTPTGGGSPQVWYIREGSSAQPTGLALKAAGDYFGQFGWDALLGWSAVAPTGLPVSN